jgi:hypothetical protein
MAVKPLTYSSIPVVREYCSEIVVMYEGSQRWWL